MTLIKLTLKGKRDSYGDGVQWRRGQLLGKGSFGSVYLAMLRESQQSKSLLPSCIAVKSAEVSKSCSLQEEQQVLAALADCPNVIHCFGEETTTGSDGTMVYNLLLEYGSGGSLYDRIHNSWGGGLPEAEVRWYTRTILEGLMHIHEVGYVHCDLKPDNILLVPRTRNGREEWVAKICDFGLSKKAQGNDQKRTSRSEGKYWRGTPMYLSPEAVKDGVQETPSDIWSVGCIVLEMLTGKCAWDVQDEGDYTDNILELIGSGLALPKIPKELSTEAKSFLSCCLRRMVRNRLPAKTLLRHPFVNVKGYLEYQNHDGLDY